MLFISSTAGYNPISVWFCQGCFAVQYFPSFGLKTERYSVSLRIQSEGGKIRTRKTTNMDTFDVVMIFLWVSFIFSCIYFYPFIPSATKDHALIIFNTNFAYSFLFAINQKLWKVFTFKVFVAETTK